MSILGKVIADGILSATKGIETIHVQADQLADIIDETFIQPASSKAFLDRVHETIKGSKIFYKELESEDGKYRLYVSMFERGLTEHRTVWVKNYNTKQVFEWNGYTLGPIREAVEKKLVMRSMRPFSSAESDQSIAGHTDTPANGVSVHAADTGSTGGTAVYCNYCGVLNQGSGRFCKECGKELKVGGASDANSTWVSDSTGDVPAMSESEENQLMNELIEYCLSALEKSQESYVKTPWSVNMPMRIDRIKENNASLAAQLKRGYLCIEEQEWAEAREFFDKALDMEAECIEAYFGILMAEKQISEEQQLKIRNTDLENNKNFKRVLRFSGEEEKQLFLRFLETEDLKQLILAGLKAASQLDDDFISKEERYMKLFPDNWISQEYPALWEIICRKKKEAEEIAEAEERETEKNRVVYCDYCGVLNEGGTICIECGRSLKKKI